MEEVRNGSYLERGEERDDRQTNFFLPCQEFVSEHLRDDSASNLFQDMACQESPHLFEVEMFSEGFNDTEDFGIPIPANEFWNHLNERPPHGEKSVLLLGLVELLEKLFGEFEKFIRQSLKKDLIFQGRGQVFKVDETLAEDFFEEVFSFL